jgi:hypothetical protein
MPWRRSAVLVVAIVLAASISTSVFAQSASNAIRPNEVFAGMVNGQLSNAVIYVVCPGPARLGQLGHPISGQTLGTESPPPSAALTGNTGSRGRFIRALLVSPVPTSSTTSTVVFSKYGTEPIPTTLDLPCSGTGSVIFVPQPTSKTAHSATVEVTYENLAVTPTHQSYEAPNPTHTITVTWADNGKSYELHKGYKLDVQLSQPSGLIWTEPASSKRAVLKRTGGSSGATATATFVAAHKGTAQVMATGSPNCTQTCPEYLLLFQVTVSVVT